MKEHTLLVRQLILPWVSGLPVGTTFTLEQAQNHDAWFGRLDSEPTKRYLKQMTDTGYLTLVDGIYTRITPS